MRVLVCGGRHFGELPDNVSNLSLAQMEAENKRAEAEMALLHSTLFEIMVVEWPQPIEIIVGGAKGADRHAYQWACEHGVRGSLFRADWQKHGRAAGPIRNQRMLDEGKPDLVVAFPGGRGTADMVRRAKASGVRVTEVAPAPSRQLKEQKA